MDRKKVAISLCGLLIFMGVVYSQPTKDEQAMVDQILQRSFTKDPRTEWKLKTDESGYICSKYPSREKMPAKEIQKVMELNKKAIKYPQHGFIMGDWKEGQKLVETSAGGRFVGYGFSDKPFAAHGGNCYACHLIEKGKPGGTLGPELTGYGKRLGITKDNVDKIYKDPELFNKVKTVYEIIYASWAYYPCSAMPRFGYWEVLSPDDIAHIVAFLLHPESPVNK
ncbi:sulfur oxidation c-type cytochrome SoxX [Thermocrinis minervae]|uniref:Monoheme cytochrome SoxX (Sulfur oxidation) n=1 Tax=Thermocrinis minervae TaxID=381751 RepID=A0A1M6T8A3_9AQUI|nr:sulfur oxidation c-type cytochrome SoxX [Thermocrinis minervae]SHK53069.1 monoheme cytochrome SoxX (sulfur oxidation) [Thermocrinis minervae]